MKKPIIAIVGLLAAAGISTGVFLKVKNNNDEEVRQKNDILADNVLFNFDSDAVNEISISSPDGKNYVIEKGVAQDEWNLAGGTDEDFSLNANTIKSLCLSIANLTANTNYGSATDENKARYGLDTPYTVTVTSDGQPYSIQIGDKSPTGDYYYVCVDGKDNIYAINSSDAEALIPGQLELMSDDLTTFGDSDIVGITLKKNGNVVYDLKYNQETSLWELPEKYSLLTVDQSSISMLVTNLTRFTAEQIVDGNVSDPAEYGFDKAAAEFTLTSADGREESMLFLHQNAAADTYTQVYLENTKQLELYYTADMKFINYTVYDFIMQTMENANMYSISGFSFNGQSAEDSFQVDTENGTVTCRGNVIDITNGEILSFFESFYNSFSYIGISDIDIYAEPDISEAVFTADYSYPDGRTFSLALVPNDNGCYYVFADGKYTGTVTEARFLTSSNSIYSLYETFCTHAGIEPVKK